MAVAKRWAAAALLAASLSACGAAYDSDGFWKSATYWQDGQASNAAMAALSKGDLVRAEALGDEAMRRNPKDPYAILALAVVYQNTGRAELARQYYEALVSMHPQATAMVGVGLTGQRRTIDEIAQAALAAMNGRPGKAYIDPPGQPVLLDVAPPPAVSMATVDPAAVEDANIILRFQTLRRLLDDGLITREEYDRRRGANLGALLRYTAPPPAVGLGLAAPPPGQVSARLKTLAAAYEEKSISAEQQAVERTTILNALLPAAPERRADKPVPPTSDIQAAAIYGRLQKLLEASVITADERSRESNAVSRSILAAAAEAEAAARAAAGMTAMPTASTGPGVQLASFSTESQARKHWSAMQKQFPDELGGLQPVIKKVALRHGRTAYRLSAGPLVDRTAAAVCRAIKRKHQTCVPTILK